METMAKDLAKNNNYYSQKPKDNSQERTTERRVLSWPSREEVWKYCEELDSSVDPDKFFDYYDERNWQTASGPVYDWQALFRAWDKKEFRRAPKKKTFSLRYGEDPVNADALKAFNEEDAQEQLNRVLNKLRKIGADEKR